MSAAYNLPYKTVNLEDFIPGCINFKWREALWLEHWQVFVHPSEQQASNIIRMARIMDAIRNIVGKPIGPTSWLRPPNYNQWPSPYGVSGAHQSAHLLGLAVDFAALTIPSKQVREILLPQLARLNIRMEDNEQKENEMKKYWIHVDAMPPGGQGRFFKV